MEIGNKELKWARKYYLIGIWRFGKMGLSWQRIFID
jgi:hypothetical protein